MHFPNIFRVGTHMRRQSSSDSSLSSFNGLSSSAIFSNSKLSDSTSSLDTHYCVKLTANTASQLKLGTGYEGEVDGFGNLSGHGIMRSTQFVYAGQWSQSKPHGYGVLYNTAARTLYEGGFHEGRANGYGRLVIYSADGDSSNDRFIYGRFEEGRFTRRRQSVARADREKGIQYVGIARRAAALAAGQSSKAMQKALRNAHLSTTATDYSSKPARASVCVSDQVPVIAMGSLTSLLASQIAAH
jgi:hypothetical protein